MALPHSFDIDINNLTKLYKDLQWKLHPDKFSQKSKEEQTHAAIQSSFINKAYFTLLKPLSRGLYLLELQGNPVDEKNTSVDPEFLMEIMEINEDVIEVASKSVVLTEIENVNRSKMDACIKLISKAFKEDDILVAKEQLVKLKYYSKVDDTIKDVHRSKMG
ncbi:hypothetical protein DPMN_114449 [Dreissena polymorpha]|uniref:Co-chaperone HscB C-terminal oligomerisation domain-containing protein n=2 Tax=Dreissena polymorpha TaxID=45954 RepID=A0A9D4QRK3_DREPO|nr:hypothetical protein DPMN_114449 [Dreissena polymorpha]